MQLAIAGGITLAVGVSPLQAQSGCRSECDRILEACKADCVSARNVDYCVTQCRQLYQECVAACE